MAEEDIIMPFGKYKGDYVSDVMRHDTRYANWLINQDWMKEKFPSLLVAINKELEEMEGEKDATKF